MIFKYIQVGLVLISLRMSCLSVCDANIYFSSLILSLYGIFISKLAQFHKEWVFPFYLLWSHLCKIGVTVLKQLAEFSC